MGHDKKKEPILIQILNAQLRCHLHGYDRKFDPMFLAVFGQTVDKNYNRVTNLVSGHCEKNTDPKDTSQGPNRSDQS